jgi:hypothetical protein
VSNGEAEYGGSDEVVPLGYGSPNAQWQFVSIWRGAGDVGGMVRGGIVHEDSFSHNLFGWRIVIKDSDGVPIVRSIGYLCLMVAPALHLVPKFRPSGGAQPSPLISNEIYRSAIIISKVSN